jgi:hypothetical protein
MSTLGCCCWHTSILLFPLLLLLLLLVFVYLLQACEPCTAGLPLRLILQHPCLIKQAHQVWQQLLQLTGGCTDPSGFTATASIDSSSSSSYSNSGSHNSSSSNSGTPLV